jgi:streptomycin 6-kinase
MITKKIHIILSGVMRTTQAAMDEAMLECNLHALIGTIAGRAVSSQRHGSALAVRALSKLAQIVDTCSGAEFMQLTRKHGVLPEVCFCCI